MTVRRVAGRLLVIALLVGAAAPCAFAAAAGQPVLLQLKGLPGDEVHYDTSFDFSANMQVAPPGAPGPVFSIAPHASGTLATVQRVESVASNGDLTLNERAESFSVSFELGDFSMQAKLAGPGGGPARFPRLPASPISTVISPLGSVVSLSGLEKLPIPPIPAGPGGKVIDLKAALPKLIQMFSKPMFPDRPVRPGDSWQSSFTVEPAAVIQAFGLQLPPQAIEMMGKVSIPVTITHTLAGVEMVNGVQTAAIKSVATWKLQMQVGPPSGPSLTLSEVGNTTMQTSLDTVAGRVARETTDLDFTMSLVTPQGASPVQMTMKGHSERQLAPGTMPPA